MQIEFEDVPVRVGEAAFGAFWGVATFSLDDAGDAYLERVDWHPHSGGEHHTTMRRSGRKAATFETILLEEVEKSLWTIYGDDLRDFEARHAPRDLGYGHLQHEML